MRCVVVFLAILLSQTGQAEVRIALVGVAADSDLIERWARDEGATVSNASAARFFRAARGIAVVLAPRPGTSPADVASLMYDSDAVLIVVDAMQGPLPINREHVILARQSRVPTVAVLLANVDRLHDAVSDDADALLRMTTDEIRAVMDAYEMAGRTALLFHDASDPAAAPRGSAGNLRKAASTIAGIGERRSRRSAAQSQRRARGQVYLLTDAEVSGRGASLDRSAAMTLWSEGASALVQVTPVSPAGPGDVAEVDMVSQAPFLGTAGSRFLLLDEARVVGIGVLTDVGR